MLDYMTEFLLRQMNETANVLEADIALIEPKDAREQRIRDELCEALTRLKRATKNYEAMRFDLKMEATRKVP